MPTYEYRCPTGHDFEKFYRKISDAGAEVPCPQCGQIGNRKLSAGAGLVFKGSGFYITDYGKDGKKDHPNAGRPKGSAESGAGESAASGAASGDGDGKTSSESKPASDAKPSTDAKPAATPAATKDAKPTPAPAPKPGKSSSE